MEYTVTFAVDGRVSVKVDANSTEEAKTKAVLESAFADLSKMEVIKMTPVNTEDENGNLTDF